MQETVSFQDLGVMAYQRAWNIQEALLQEALQVKRRGSGETTTHHLLFVEHPPVYTLGKSGKMEHVLLDEAQRTEKGIQFFHTNRGGDITFHGPEQLVGYPILDLEKNFTPILAVTCGHWKK